MTVDYGSGSVDDIRHREFEAAYALSVGRSVADLHGDDIWSAKCHCGCGGFYMRRGAMIRYAAAGNDGPYSAYRMTPILDSHRRHGLPRTRKARL